ncbi:MAG: hypothetical protein SVU32_08240 [Candidatus Nanohaloarchaea archaeon]|nr:hypothetical protein [Candidatus Nanohaloarchaea archaeon]
MSDSQDFTPLQTTVGDLEITVTTEHGEAVRQHTPLEDQLVLEISRSGTSNKQVFKDLVPERIDELEDAIRQIEDLIRRIEQKNEREWICKQCETIIITAGGKPTESCECGQEQWQPLHEAEDMSIEEEEVLKNLYLLTPGEPVKREEAVQEITEASVLDPEAVDTGISRLIEKGILLQNDKDTIERR